MCFYLYGFWEEVTVLFQALFNNTFKTNLYKMDRLSQNNPEDDKLYCLRLTDFEVKKNVIQEGRKLV